MYGATYLGEGYFGTLSGAAVEVTNPGEQHTVLGVEVTLAIKAKNATEYSASGLPQGLTINEATGVINGVPTVAESPAVTVEVKGAGGTAKCTFTWVIEEAGPPLVKRVWAGPFFGLYRGRRIAQGASVEIPAAETISPWFK